MYNPDHFREERAEILHAAVRDIKFAALVTHKAGELAVSHLPMLLHEAGGTLWLESHVARANDHWRDLADDAASVAIFQGPQAYITPSWYPSKAVHGKVVPTWAYIAVHARGPLEPVTDGDWLHAHLDRLTRQNEAGRDAPWALGDAPDSFLAGMKRGIVGLRMRVDTLEGKWKLNQHKPADDSRGTRDGLAQAGGMGPALAAALGEIIDT